MLAVEPEKVGVEIVALPEDKAQISGYTWFDTNKNGFPDENEEGINEIGVFLVDEFGVIQDFTFTTKNFEGKDGYYSFGNLDFGTYYLRFLKNPNLIFTIRNEDVNGSHVNPTTNYSDKIQLDIDNRMIIVNGGLINRPRIDIEKILEVNKSANSTVKNVVRNQLLLTMKMENTSDLILKNK